MIDTENKLDTIGLSLLQPIAVWKDGKIEHHDETTGELISESTMNEYNQYYGLSGYDELNEFDEGNECNE